MPADLRAAAAVRWGEPKPLRGHYIYRPAKAPTPAPLPAPAPAVKSPTDDALAHAVGCLELGLALPPATVLAEVFRLDLDVAEAVLAEARSRVAPVLPLPLNRAQRRASARRSH